MALPFLKLENPADIGTSQYIGAGWSHDGNYLTVGSDNTPSGRLYKRVGKTLQRLTLNPAPAANARVNSWSREDKYFAFNSRAANGFSLWRRDGNDVFTNISANIDVLPPVNRQHSWSPVDNVLVVSVDTAPYLYFYRYDPATDLFTRMTVTFDVALAARGFQAEISPDGQYIAITGTANPQRTIYKIVRTSQTAWSLVRVYSQNTGAEQYSVAWHMSSNYLVFGGQASSSALTILKKTGVDTFAILAGAAPNAQTSQTFVAWSKDGNYVFGSGNTAADRDNTWEFDQATETFTLQNAPNPRPTGYGQAVAVTDDITYFVFTGTMGGAPYFAWYELGAAEMSFSATAPMADAVLIGTDALKADLVAMAPMAEARLGLLNSEKLSIVAEAPMATAWITTAAPELVLRAEAPMADAYVQMTSSAGRLFGMAPMAEAVFTATGSFADVVALAPMASATFDIPNVYVDQFFAEAPMASAWAQVSGPFVNVQAVAPMASAQLSVQNTYITELSAAAPMATAQVNLQTPAVSFNAMAPMAEAFFVTARQGRTAFASFVVRKG